MEEFSVLRTPGYPKYHGNIAQHNNPQYSSRYGYTIAYYEPIYDIDFKIPGLGIGTVPFIPIQHIRKSRLTRPFVPRNLTEEDMIQINLRAERKAKDILKDFHPAQKASYETARDFRTRKEIESRMEDIRESCANANNYYRKAEKYDFTRRNVYIPRTKTRFEDKDNLKDLILDSKVEHINDIKTKLGEDRDNHRAKFRALSAGCKEFSKKNEDKEEQEEVEDSASTKVTRKTSRDTRAEQLKELQERFKKQETESDCFERTFGRHLSKLRGEVNSLTDMTDDYIGDTRYRSFKLNQITRNAEK